MSTVCGYSWEDEDLETASGQCQGHHECILSVGHSDAEHECSCGDIASEPQ